MIIAAFAGTGKTYFCEHVPQAIDFVCMPWKYTNFYEVASFMEEGEQIKANDELELNFGWQKEYYDALIDTVKKYPDQIVVIPTVSAVQRMLEADDMPYTVVIPKQDLKDEYEQRYIARGNTEEFLDVFIGSWDWWMNIVRKNICKNVIELESGQYLYDVLHFEKAEHLNIIENKKDYIFNTYFSNR